MLKRLNYLTHRWIGIVLGILVFVWFGSGIVMMYYPYPELTESQQLRLLNPYSLAAPTPAPAPAPLIGVRRAVELYPGRDSVSAVRLQLWDGHLVYALMRDHRGSTQDLARIDARDGQLLTPISPETAARVARTVVGPLAPLERVELLANSDHYFMGNEQRWAFPVYRVRFGDHAQTAVYVSRNSGALPAVVTRATRITTWLGTVPHWLYFMWLYYDHPDAWEWVNLILPGVAVGLAVTGIILGVYQLFPRRRRGEWRMSGYHGMSLWHHVTGVVFGLLVLTWALSGLLEILGVGNDPRPGQAERARGGGGGGGGGAVRWAAIRVGEAAALTNVSAATGAPPRVIVKAIDLRQLDGHPGYRVLLQDGRAYWVDAESGTVRGELAPEAVAQVAGQVLGSSISISKIERVDRYDAYYYARHGREKHLPAWRVSFDDADHSVLYLDTVSGAPVGFVDAATRSWRWWRDGLHDLDFPALNNRRPWWDLVVLPLMIGGTISAVTGTWLLFRRLLRVRGA